MVRTMIRKSEYRPCACIGENIYKLMFGREDVTNEILEKNADGKDVPTGKKEETEYCSVNVEVLYFRPSPEFVASLLEKSGNTDLDEANEILSAFTDEPLPHLKRLAANNISIHDASDAVNRFTMGGVPMWLDKSTRTGLRMRLDAEDNAGKKGTTLWYGRYSVTLSVRQAMEMLLELELYASRCYDRTQEHLSAVAAMDSPEQLLAYDYTTGYPEMLEF